MKNQKLPFTPEQQEILMELREAKVNLEIARKSRSIEIDRRLVGVRVRAAMEVDAEINALDVAFDDTMVAAVGAGISIRRLALDVFNVPHDGSIRRMVLEALEDRRDPSEATGDVSGNSLIPKPALLNQRTSPSGAPRFTLVSEDHTLHEDDETRISAKTVLLELDPFDPWIATMHGNGRKGSPTLAETACTIYRNPGTGKMIALESPESGATFYDHLAARWVKDHQDEASTGYDSVALTA